MTRFVIEEDGSTWKETIGREQINLQPQIDAVFQANATVKLEHVVDFSELGEPLFGPASLSLSPDGNSYWSVMIKMLNLNCTFGMTNDVMHPTFEKEGKFMEVKWKPPETMRLVLGMHITYGFQPMKHYLVAYDGRGATWRLPLSNLYNHLELCHGQHPIAYRTAIEAAINALKKFRCSKWNSDLFGEFHQQNTHQMFRFKPTNEGFDQLPPMYEDWTSMCEKASCEVVNKNIMPL